MKNLFSVANETYQGDSNIRSLEKIINHARDQYRKNRQVEAFKTLKEISDVIRELFNFKDVNVNLNTASLGLYNGNEEYGFSSATTSLCHVTLSYGTQKKIDIKDLEYIKNAYKCEKPILYCNIAISASKVFGDEAYNSREIVALILQQLAYSFYAWTSGKKVTISIIQSLNILSAISNSNSDTKSEEPILEIAPSYINESMQSYHGLSNAELMQFMNKMGSMLGAGALVAIGPILAALSCFTSPINTTLDIINKIFGVDYNEVNTFTEQFIEHYGYSKELNAVINKFQSQDKNTPSAKSFNSFLDLYAEVFTVSAVAYNWVSNKVECINSTSVLTRIESIIVCYEKDLDSCKGNKEICAELRDKIKSLKLIYENLKAKPRENFTPSAITAKLWTKLFSIDTTANSLDKEIEEIKKGKKSRFK